MISYEDFGNIADGRRLLLGDFRGIGRSQLLFHNTGDHNWWLGTFDGGAQEFCWALAGHSSAFGPLLPGHMFFTGRFKASAGRDEVLFYNPGNPTWWLSTVDEALPRLQWETAGNARGLSTILGNILAGRFWVGQFSTTTQDQLLYHSPADQSWWLGSLGTGRSLTWLRAGNSTGAGNLLNGQRLWFGRFSSADRDQVLRYDPESQNWWFGSFDPNNSQLSWTAAGNTAGVGNLATTHQFWAGRFSRADRSEILCYAPVDHKWWLGSYDATTSKLAWSEVGDTTVFGNLLEGHRIWTGRFSESERDQILFYSYADQSWSWSISTFDSTTKTFVWKTAAITGNLGLGNGSPSITGRFARSDRTELLVRHPDQHRWWLAAVNDDWGGLWWRMTLNSERPRASSASTILRNRLREIWGQSLAGCVFYVTRDGRPFADGSFGEARRPGAADGELPMTASTIVHVGSITKFFCAVAILRLIEEWNRVVGRPPYPNDSTFIRTVRSFGTQINLDTKVFPLLEQYIDRTLAQGYPSFPGANVRDVTLRQVLNHTSRLPHLGSDVSWNAFLADLGGVPRSAIVNEPGDESPTSFDLVRFVTAYLKQGATFPTGYNNDAYAVLTAVIEATTGMTYAAWLKQHIFDDPRFDDLAPKVADTVRSARYYFFDGANFLFGNHHPDYTDFTLAGGYYVSAAVFAEWVEAVMQKKTVGHGPVLDHPELLLTDRPGLGGYAVERFRGYTKNGGASPGGGNTNASFVFLRGYGNERIFAFTEANGNVDADLVRDKGLVALAESLTRSSGLAAPTTAVGSLRQTVFWNDAVAGNVASASADIAVSTAPVLVGGVTADRTRLLGSALLAGGKSRGDVTTVELRGSVKTASAGLYVFRLASDDGAFLWLNDELIMDNWGDHGMRFCESDGIWLDANAWYPLHARWYNAGASADLCLEWRQPGTSTFVAVPGPNFAPRT